MKKAGWKQWSFDPRSQYHYFKQDPTKNSRFLSACESYGIYNIVGFEDPQEDRKCKVCLNYMQTSGGTP